MFERIQLRTAQRTVIDTAAFEIDEDPPPAAHSPEIMPRLAWVPRRRSTRAVCRRYLRMPEATMGRVGAGWPRANLSCRRLPARQPPAPPIISGES